MMAAMKSIPLRAQRIAQVKFVALPLEACPPLVPPVRVEIPVSRSKARFVRWLRRIAIRVIGSPTAARP
jgi:hypothetical protein